MTWPLQFKFWKFSQKFFFPHLTINVSTNDWETWQNLFQQFWCWQLGEDSSFHYKSKAVLSDCSLLLCSQEWMFYWHNCSNQTHNINSSQQQPTPTAPLQLIYWLKFLSLNINKTCCSNHWLLLVKSKVMSSTQHFPAWRLQSNDLTIGWQNSNLLSHPDATLAPKSRQARTSGEILNFLLSR